MPYYSTDSAEHDINLHGEAPKPEPIDFHDDESHDDDPDKLAAYESDMLAEYDRGESPFFGFS
ncbi:hypothetical protein [Neptuniibacter sp. QD37_11]|uniref:hypothetical protein n=1 Tax=Neptuniibacter sp. QD37_11 TaxID=3398209 RepID=UPI0039F458AE